MASGLSPERAPRPPLIAWLVIAGGLLASLGAVLLAQKLAERITTQSPGMAVTLFDLVLFGPLAVLALVLGLLSRIKVLRAGEAPLRWLGIGLAAGAAGLVVSALLSWLNGGMLRGEAVSHLAGLIALGVALTVFQVAAEELLFRGWLQPALIARIGGPAGVMLGALLFAAFHYASGATHAAMSLLTLTLGGLFFGLLALRSGGIVAPLAAHVAWNALEDLGAGLVPNPGIGPLGALFNLDLTGSVWWGGHEEGLNVSLGSVAVLLALILPLLPALQRPAPAEPLAT